MQQEIALMDHKVQKGEQTISFNESLVDKGVLHKE
jgi:hypothetical protein